jgi:hypothetical protein
MDEASSAYQTAESTPCTNTPLTQLDRAQEHPLAAVGQWTTVTGAEDAVASYSPQAVGAACLCVPINSAATH